MKTCRRKLRLRKRLRRDGAVRPLIRTFAARGILSRGFPAEEGL